MHTNEPRQDPLTDLGYEPRDVEIKPIVKGVIYFFIFASFGLVFSWVFLAGIHVGPIQFNGFSPQYSHTFEQNKRVMPPKDYPLIQSNMATRGDIQALRQHEEVRLNGYGYTDEAKTKASIPVEQAIDAVAAGQGIKTGNAVDAVSKGNTISEKTPLSFSPGKVSTGSNSTESLTLTGAPPNDGTVRKAASEPESTTPPKKK